MHFKCRFPQRAIRLLSWCRIENKQIDTIVLRRLVADNRARVPIVLVGKERVRLRYSFDVNSAEGHTCRMIGMRGLIITGSCFIRSKALLDFKGALRGSRPFGMPS